MHDIIAYLIKHVPAIQWMYNRFVSAFFKFVGLFVKTDDQLVLLSSYGGDRYDDSPKVIFEAMQKDPRFAQYKYVWAFGEPKNFDIPGAQTVKIDTMSYFVTALKAKLWITNVNIERGLRFKKKNTVYLNTWHGTGPKKSGNAVKGRKDYDFSYVDILCVDGKYLRDIMVNWFNARDEHLLYSGRPREDALLNMTENDTVKIREKLGIPVDKKVLLYMPTWREYGNEELDAALWENALSDDYVMLVRAHHFSKSNIMSADQKFWIDVTAYPEVNDLYWIADVLVSDYSSAFFDYGLLSKPIICFAYDYDRYSTEYGLFVDMREDFPNGVQITQEDAIQLVKNMDYQAECVKAKAYVDSYLSRPGNATKACLDKIFEKLQENRN